MALTFGNKIENNGTTPRGRLTAAEFNTMVAAINQNELGIVHTNDVMRASYPMTNGLSLGYDLSTRQIQLIYTLNQTPVILSHIDANDFVVSGSLSQASYSTTNEASETGHFLKLQFTSGTVYIDLQPLLDNALETINERLTQLENGYVIMTAEEYDLLAVKDPNIFYCTYEDEE